MWADIVKQIDDDLDEHISETVTLIPITQGEWGLTADVSRATIDVPALIVEHDQSSISIAKMDGRMPYGEVEIAVRRSQIPPDYKIRKGDQVRFIDRDPVMLFEISRIERLDQNRLGFSLKPLGESE
jgi:hypothetical protein